MNWRRILLILGLLVGVILMAFILYSVFFAPVAPRPPVVAPPAVNKPPVSGVLPPSGAAPQAVNAPPPPPANIPVPPRASSVALGGLTKSNFLVSQPVAAATQSADRTGLNYYDKTKGQFYKLTPIGPQLLSSKVFADVNKVNWSPKGDQAIMEFPDNSKILYNFQTDQQVTLPKHWEQFNFAPDGSHIAFKSMGADFDNRWLAVSTPAGDEVKIISPLGDNRKVVANWSPNNQMVGMWTENLDANRSELFFLGFNDENFKSTTLEGQGFVGHWTPKGDKILYSVYSPATDYKPALWIVDAVGNDIGNGKQMIGLETWADKCAFSKDNATAYCAAPKQLPEGAGIFRPAVQDAVDQFYKVNLKTGTYDLLAVPDHNVTATNLVLSDDEKQLFFVDSQTNFLADINLQQ